jgi:energy-coupling factor transport system permease protein
MIDSRAVVLWLVASMAVVFAMDNPAIDILVIAAAWVLASSHRTAAGYRGLLLAGLVLVAVRTVLFALTGHTGETVFFVTPTLDLPALLGGTSIGGPITAEVVVFTAAESLRIVAVMACVGAFIAISEPGDLIRLVPRFAFEAGLVVSIAMTFAPQIGRTIRDVREAQIMRGSKRRSIPSFFLPVLSTALDRSISLAESMDSRGYGRHSPGSRTRYPKFRWTRDDRLFAAMALIAGSVALAAAAAGMTGTEIDPYRTLALPEPSVAGILATLLLSAPAILTVPKGSR